MPSVPVPSPKKYVTHSFTEKKRAVELFESGLSSRRIAREMNVDDSLVRRWLRRYYAAGAESLHPYRRISDPDRRTQGIQAVRRAKNERLFSPALAVYCTTLEPVASIARRYGLDYQSLMYHIRRFHPEMVERRSRLYMPWRLPGTLRSRKMIN